MVVVFILLATLMSFSSCGNINQTDTKNKADTNQINRTQLTDREKMFLSAGNRKYLVFDFSLDDTYNWIEIWVERYENGEIITDNVVLSKQVSANEKGIILISVDEDKDLKTNWIAAVESGSAKGSSKFNEYYAEAGSILLSSWSANDNEVLTITDKKIVLGSALYKSAAESIRSLSVDFLNDPDNHIEELMEFDLAYIIKCRFLKKDQ
jgi:hypothetical protein